MNSLFRKLLIIPFIVLVNSCHSPVNNNNTFVLIKTTMGEIKIKLYDETPLHRNNFIKVVKSGIYENVSFHRVIKDFMIQTGDPLTNPQKPKNLPDSLNTYTIPAEFNPLLFHKKGALAAARTGNDVNPDMRSSGTQFYIVQGTKYEDTEINQAEQMINSNIKQAVFAKLIKFTTDSLKAAGQTTSDSEIQSMASLKMYDYLTNFKPYKITDDQRNTYKTTGGTPRLDGTYTVFGEVTEGLDVVDRIAAVPTDSNDKPVNDIRILKIKIVSK